MSAIIVYYLFCQIALPIIFGEAGSSEGKLPEDPLRELHCGQRTEFTPKHKRLWDPVAQSKDPQDKLKRIPRMEDIFSQCKNPCIPPLRRAGNSVLVNFIS